MPFSKARHLVPRSPNGAPRAPSTLWRWSRRGVDGVRLRTVAVGRTTYTCEKWMREFWEDLARQRFSTEDAVAGSSAEPKAGRTSYEGHDTKVEAELDAMGITGRIASRRRRR